MTTQPLEITKLSQAIREGAKLRPQITFLLFAEVPEEDGAIGSCAFGAALEALGRKADAMMPQSDVHVLMHEHFPGLLRQLVKHPVTGDVETLYYVVTDLNDFKHWSREQSADWLEKLGY